MTWAEDRLKDINELIAENRRLLDKYPDKVSLKLSLKSKEQHREELLEKIRKGE